MNTFAKTKKIVIIAGETSGDMHGAALIKSIKELNPAIEIFGMGGDKMREAGVEIFFESPKIAVTGFIEVLKHLNKFKQAFRLVVEKLEEIQPDAVVLIDYPGFNLRLAKEVKARDIKLFYYISPQVWAWGKGRVKTIRKFVDKMLVVFKFEEDFYKEHNINAVFVGHPLMDIISEYNNIPHPPEKIGTDTNTPNILSLRGGDSNRSNLNRRKDEAQSNLNKIASLSARNDLNRVCVKIALLPGSRENEVKYILPIMLETSLLLQKKINSAEFMLAAVNSVKKETYQKITSRYPVKNLVWHNDKSYDCLLAADFALVCSGTATLETAIFGKPMAVIYKMSLLSYLIIKSLIKIPYIGMVNLVVGKKIVPEFVQFQARPKAIADYALKILNDPSARGKIETKLAEVKKKLGASGAARRAAEVILEEMEK